VTFGRSVVFSVYLVPSINEIDGHDLTQILWKVALNTITLSITLKIMIYIFNNYGLHQ
jgi:hypothetical protein